MHIILYPLSASRPAVIFFHSPSALAAMVRAGLTPTQTIKRVHGQPQTQAHTGTATEKHMHAQDHKLRLRYCAARVPNEQDMPCISSPIGAQQYACIHTVIWVDECSTKKFCRHIPAVRHAIVCNSNILTKPGMHELATAYVVNAHM